MVQHAVQGGAPSTLAPWDEFRPLLSNVRKSGRNSYKAQCPGHQGDGQSLSITVEPDGKLLLHCFVGCSNHDICRAINFPVSHLFPPHRRFYRSEKKQAPATVDDEYAEDVAAAEGFVMLPGAIFLSPNHALSAVRPECRWTYLVILHRSYRGTKPWRVPLRDLAELADCSVSSARRYVNALKELGWIAVNEGIAKPQKNDWHTFRAKGPLTIWYQAATGG